jgi:hypothetical protein
VAGVVEGLQLVAMKSVLAIRHEVERQTRHGDQNQDTQVRAKKIRESFPHGPNNRYKRTHGLSIDVEGAAAACGGYRAKVAPGYNHAYL